MSDKATVYLPLASYVNVRAFTNALFLQRVTITEEKGSVHTLTGSGEHDTPFPKGAFAIRTPSSSANPRGYRVTVEIDTSRDKEKTWQPSQVSQASCGVMYYQLAMIVSEDNVDNDWNDSVVQFTWWIPSVSRSPADVER